jgi:broad specificity phosphatase PhoE
LNRKETAVNNRSHRKELRMFKRPWPYVVVVAATVGLLYWWCGLQTTVLLVRHANRLEGQDSLTAPGLARAQELVHVAEKTNVSVIITSDANRAVQTAQPLATTVGITPITLPGNDIQAFANQVRAHRGATILVVGHSNTVPQIIAALGGPTLPNINGVEFDNLFVLTICRCGWRGRRLVHLQYGVVSP